MWFSRAVIFQKLFRTKFLIPQNFMKIYVINIGLHWKIQYQKTFPFVRSICIDVKSHYKILWISLQNPQSIAMIESNILPEDGHFSECQCWGAPNELQPVTMRYRNSAREAMFRAQPDPNFRFDLICTFILFLTIGLIQIVVFKR